jgi:protein CpxP
MKIIKQAVLAAALTFGVVGAGFAQDQKTNDQQQGKKNHEARMEKFAQKLNLNDDQKTKLKALHEEKRAKMQALKSDGSLTQEQKREQFRAMREDFQTRRDSILTDEQKSQLKKMQAEHKQRHRGRHRRHGDDRQLPDSN